MSIGDDMQEMMDEVIECLGQSITYRVRNDRSGGIVAATGKVQDSWTDYTISANRTPRRSSPFGSSATDQHEVDYIIKASALTDGTTPIAPKFGDKIGETSAQTGQTVWRTVAMVAEECAGKAWRITTRDPRR